MWDKQIQYFSTSYHCIAPDFPEQGTSNDGTYFSIKDSAEKVISFIEKKAKGRKVIVIGFSLGAQVTIQMLSINPDLIDYAMINSALVKPSSFTKRLIKPSIKLTFPLIKNKAFSKLQAKALHIGKEHIEKYYIESSQMKRDTLIRILEENMSFEIPNHFNRASGKILVTVGEKERSLMKKSALDIVRNNPNCVGIMIPKIGHGIPLAKPDYFNQLIENWLGQEDFPKEVEIIT